MLGSRCLLPGRLTLLPTRTNGYRDIGVNVCGGGILRCYQGRLQFDGWKYPGDPNGAYAVRGKPKQSVLIRGEERGLPLF